MFPGVESFTAMSRPETVHMNTMVKMLHLCKDYVTLCIPEVNFSTAIIAR